MKRKYIFIASGIIIIVILIIGISFISSREFRERSLNLVFRPQKGLVRTKPDYRFDADYFYTLYEGSEAKSDSLFIDKVIQVTGSVAEVIKENDGKVSVILRDDFSFAGVNCSMDERFLNENIDFKKGDIVTLKGVCAGMLMDVVLMRCVISE